MSDNNPPSETFPVAPVFYDGCCAVQVLNGLVHMTLWQYKTKVDVPGEMEKVVVAYIMARAETIALQHSIVNEAIARDGNASSNESSAELH